MCLFLALHFNSLLNWFCLSFLSVWKHLSDWNSVKTQFQGDSWTADITGIFKCIWSEKINFFYIIQQTSTFPQDYFFKYGLASLWHSHLNLVFLIWQVIICLLASYSKGSYHYCIMSSFIFVFLFSSVHFCMRDTNCFSFCVLSSCNIRKKMEVIFWMDMIKCFYYILLYIIFLSD